MVCKRGRGCQFSRYVVTRDTYIDDGKKEVRLKAKAGSGRRSERWVDVLHKDLRSEFERMSALEVKFNFTSLKHIALHILKNSDSPHYSANMTNPRKDLPPLH